MSITKSEAAGFTVIFEDNHLIVVNKSSGILVQGDKTGDIPLSELVKIYLKEKYNKPGNVFAGVIHRIDRPVSGLVLLAKTSKALERMNKAFSEKQIEKTYWAVVKGNPAATNAVLKHYLVKDSNKNITKAYDKQVEGSKQSELSYRVVGQINNYSLLEVKPVTGRPHQIRCQLAAIGSPIRGDLKYGYPRSNEGGGINLHALRLQFIHPVSQDLIKLQAPLPNEKFWQFFKEFENF